MSHHHSQKTVQVNKQSQLIDQNFANNILFMNMSTLEALEQNMKGIKDTKIFEAYDPIDSSSRPIEVLKEELRLGLYQVEFSYKSFIKSYGNQSYTLPKGYNLQKVLQRLKQFYVFFNSKGEHYCAYMTLDLINILTCKNDERQYMKMKFTSQGKSSMAQNARNMIIATKMTHDEQQQMIRIYEKNSEMLPEDLMFKHKKQTGMTTKRQIKTIHSQYGKYIGEVDEYNIAQGNGIFYQKNGSIFEGNFTNGRLNGTIKQTAKNKEVYYIQYVHGSIVNV